VPPTVKKLHDIHDLGYIEIPVLPLKWYQYADPTLAPMYQSVTYRGQKAAIRVGAPRAKNFTNQRYRWGKRIDASVQATNRRQFSVRAKVEHMFGVIKRVFGFQKVCYRGLAKNLHRLEVTAALANLFLSRRRLPNA